MTDPSARPGPRGALLDLGGRRLHVVRAGPESSALPMVVELAGRGLGLAVVPTSIPNGPGILRLTEPQLRSRLELAWRCAPAANPAARALIEQARALGPPGRSVP